MVKTTTKTIKKVVAKVSTKVSPKKVEPKAAEQTTLNELLITKLRSLYDVEQQLAKALPKLVKNAGDDDLRRDLENYGRLTEKHIKRLESAFDALGERPQKLAGEAIRGIITDADWVIKNIKGDVALDAGLVAAAQIARHYEIAEYESVVAWAKVLDENEVADLLEKTLDEEQEASEELAELASTKINERAGGIDTDSEDKKNTGVSESGEDGEDKDDEEDEDDDEELEREEE